MRIWLFAFTLSLASFLVSCGSGAGSGDIASHGPFDADGNYIEAWADRRPRWAGKKKSSAEKIKKVKAKPETRIVKVTPKPKPVPRVVASRIVERKPIKTVSRPKPKPAVYTPSRPKPKPKAKPRPKPRPKAKPKPLRLHRVTKGDTLYGLSRKYGTTVSAIQKANGLRGTNIITGSNLKIPH